MAATCNKSAGKQNILVRMLLKSFHVFAISNTAPKNNVMCLLCKKIFINQPVKFNSQITDGHTGNNITTLCSENGVYYYDYSLDDELVVIGTSNSIALHFHTDYIVTYRGWAFTWSGWY